MPLGEAGKMSAGNVGVVPPAEGRWRDRETTEKEVWPCRRANPPVEQPAHAPLRVAADSFRQHGLTPNTG